MWTKFCHVDQRAADVSAVLLMPSLPLVEFPSIIADTPNFMHIALISLALLGE